MFKTILKSWCRYWGGWASFFLIIAIVVMCAAGALMWRLSKGPLDLDFAKVHIENALSDLDRNFVTQIDKAYLTWPDVSDPFLIELSNVQITQEAETVLAVEDFSLVLSGLDLLKGKILPSRIIITEPELKIIDERGNFNAFWQDNNKKPKEVYGPVKPRKVTKDNVRDLLSKITNSQNQELQTLSALRTIQIKDAKIVGRNNEKLADLNLKLKKHDEGIFGDLVVDYEQKSEKKAQFKSDILYRRTQEDLTFTANLKDLHTKYLNPFLSDIEFFQDQNLFMNGDLKAAFNKNLDLDNAQLNINIPSGKINLPDVYKNPPQIKDLTANIVFNHEQQKIAVENFSAQLSGVPIHGSLNGQYKDGAIMAPLELKIPTTTIENLRKLLPDSQNKKVAGAWLNRKLETGNIQNLIMQTNLTFNQNKTTKKYDIDFDLLKVNFDFSDMTVKYHPTLTAVSRAKGSGRYEDDDLFIKGSEGYINDLTGTDVDVKVTNLSVSGGGIADINVKANGPFKSALQYVSNEPINADDNLGFDIKEVKGNIDFKVNVNLPTIKGVPKEDVKVTLNGVVNNITLPNVVRGLSLEGGPYNLSYGKGVINLKGLGKLSGRNIDLDWKQYINPTGKEFESKIKAKIVADKDLRSKFGVGLTEYLDGDVPIDITYTDKGVNATLDLTGDLTPASLRIDEFGYTKSIGEKGNLSLQGIIKGADLTQINNLNIQAPNFILSNGRLAFVKDQAGVTDVKSGIISNVELNRNRANVEFEITNNKTLKAIIKGPVVDVSRYIKTDKTSNEETESNDNRAMILSIDADKMIAVDNKELLNTKLYLELNKKGEPTRIEMDADVGKGAMFVRFKPDGDGNRNFELNATDAGEMLRAFGLYKNMRGGVIEISGQPQRSETGDDLYGRARITNFSIRRAPALAKMMDAMSLQGVDNLINNDGIVFKKLASDFEWKFRETGNLLVVKEGRTSGSSLGLTFAGVMNIGAGSMDLSGTAIPLSGVSKVIGEIPLIGDLLGGDGGLFAATYSMKGQTRDPKVTINPLSVLAPGFVRKILFEDDVDKKVKKEERKSQ